MNIFISEERVYMVPANILNQMRSFIQIEENNLQYIMLSKKLMYDN